MQILEMKWDMKIQRGKGACNQIKKLIFQKFTGLLHLACASIFFRLCDLALGVNLKNLWGFDLFLLSIQRLCKEK